MADIRLDSPEVDNHNHHDPVVDNSLAAAAAGVDQASVAVEAVRQAAVDSGPARPLAWGDELGDPNWAMVPDWVLVMLELEPVACSVD
jgi:hypothetical protein